MERYIVEADSQNTLQPPTPTGGRYLCSNPVSTYYIFTTYDSARCNIDDTKATVYRLRDI